MSFVCIEYEEYVVHGHINRKRKVYVYKCDTCEKFIRRRRNLKFDKQFCSLKCQRQALRKDGCLYSKERILAAHEKCKQTWLEHYGNEEVFAAKTIRQQIDATNLVRYGGKNCMASSDVRKRKEKTCIEKYGVEHSFQSETVKSKIYATFIEKYGTDHCLKSDVIKEKCKETWLRKLGVDNPRKSDIVKRKSIETMKHNKSFRKSIPEDKCYELLCEKFGVENVERQYYINGWHIDFYVKSIDTYVQLDGVYWHGLDRPIEVIAEHKTKRDAQIHKKYLTDRKQDSWFNQNQLKLVRITDKEIQNEDFRLFVMA